MTSRRVSPSGSAFVIRLAAGIEAQLGEHDAVQQSRHVITHDSYTARPTRYRPDHLDQRHRGPTALPPVGRL